MIREHSSICRKGREGNKNREKEVCVCGVGVGVCVCVLEKTWLL